MNMTKNSKLLIVLLCGLLVSLSGCNGKRDKGSYYRQYKVDVRCADMFSGVVYGMGHTKAIAYSIKYELESGQEISLPNYGGDCVMIKLEEYSKPKESKAN
jgi:hypothetical protein